jgi:hypothetical protein
MAPQSTSSACPEVGRSARRRARGATPVLRALTLSTLPFVGSCAYLGSLLTPDPVPIMEVELAPVEDRRAPLPPAARALPTPAPTIRVDHYPGTPLSGPRARASAPEGEALALEPRAGVRWTLLALHVAPPEDAAPLAARAELLVEPGSKSPLRVRTRLAREAELWNGPTAELEALAAQPGALLLARRSAVLMQEQSARLSLERAPDAERVELAVWSPSAEAVRLTVAVQGLDVRTETDGSRSAIEAAAAEPSAHLEFLPLAEDLPAPGAATWLLLPDFFPAGNGLPSRDLLACIERLPETPSAEDPQAVEALEVAARAARVESGAEGSPIQPAQRLADLSRQNAVEALRRADTRRSALIRLADSHGAPLCADMALVGGEELIVAIADRVEPLWSRIDLEIDGTWVLERAAVNAAGTLLQRDALGDPAAAALLRHAGEAGRFGSTLLDAARDSADRAAFQARLIEENRLFLTDRNPAARSRALRFLRDLGQAPADFDPLAPRDVRRAALQADRERREASAPNASTR